MNAKASYTSASLLSLLFASAALCQAPPAGAPVQLPAPVAVNGDGAPSVGSVEGAPGGVVEGPTPIPDPWITYPQAHCCGPVGGNGPILMEIYTRVGPTFPVGGHAMTRALGTGWEIGAGGRSLFFNVARDRAFTVDLGISNAYNRADDGGILFRAVHGPARIQAMNRTFATLGLGQEFWLLHPVNTCCGDGWNWRCGYDGGCRYGTVRVDTTVPATLPDFPAGYARFNNRLYGTYLALHSDIEIPRGCCTHILGARLEWQYDWIGTFGSRSDVQGVNLLFNAGLRF